MRLRAFALFFMTLATAACGSEATLPQSAAVGEMPADNVIDGLSHNLTRNGVRASALRADTAHLYQQQRRMELQGVHLTFYSEAGLQTGTLTSDTGDYHTGTRSFVARGNVVLITQGPQGTRRLTTEELHYDVPGDQLWSDVPFTLEEAGRTTRGTSFRSDSQFETWSVTQARTEDGGSPGTGVSF
jgi:LPS export ABC transporter protein LptC